MRILLAPDSFKEAASAEAIAQAMARGIKRGNPQAECRLMPLSDGGEGLTQALVHATAGTLHNVETVDAIGRPITAQFGFLGNNHASCILHTAVVELASASGLERVSPADRNALSASTFGTGLLNHRFGYAQLVHTVVQRGDVLLHRISADFGHRRFRQGQHHIITFGRQRGFR